MIGHFPMAGEWLVGLLVLLVCIHVYWFSIIVQIAYRKVMTGVTEDVRGERGQGGHPPGPGPYARQDLMTLHPAITTVQPMDAFWSALQTLS